MTPFGRRFSRSSFLPERVRPVLCLFQSGLHTTCWTPFRLGPLRGDPLDAGAAAVHQDHVGVLLAGTLSRRAMTAAGSRDVLPARDGDEGSAAAGAPVVSRSLLCALEVAGVDGGGGEVAGLADVAAVTRAPDLAGLDAVAVRPLASRIFSNASRRSPKFRARGR